MCICSNYVSPIDSLMCWFSSVFECAYARLVMPWYGVPEPCEHQPLHMLLSREFDFVIDRIIERSRDFDVCQAVVGSIRILTQHLHNAKQPDRYDVICLLLRVRILALSTMVELRKLFIVSHRLIINHILGCTCSAFQKACGDLKRTAPHWI